MEFLSTNAVIILAALLALSELLGLVPAIKANSIFGLIVSGLKKLLETVKPKA
jgi:cell division protein ZapA (FtsZ GTPase activity inhibitor)